MGVRLWELRDFRGLGLCRFRPIDDERRAYKLELGASKSQFSCPIP